MPERRVVVGSSVGLHARPAALFVKAAAAQPVPVTIGLGDGEPVDARSLLSVMGLAAKHGDEVVLRAEGPEADAALAELATVVATDHD
ncbi:HPr family phosphocarrier protein [Amycolatopsis sp.]|uniref:HPr family phosphocarrier protein n=1 Tax=Amycolatopsis sp. TaxID=37632 RepID=UPI002C780D2C|nr:HPr family phosphocarrier protein [Amycolatopsis sp.]HVV12996.1 HPr family phosphocarrier protein [Amycolatopsis sp.]